MPDLASHYSPSYYKKAPKNSSEMEGYADNTAGLFQFKFVGDSFCAPKFCEPWIRQTCIDPVRAQLKRSGLQLWKRATYSFSCLLPWNTFKRVTTVSHWWHFISSKMCTMKFRINPIVPSSGDTPIEITSPNNGFPRHRRGIRCDSNRFKYIYSTEKVWARTNSIIGQ